MSRRPLSPLSGEPVQAQVEALSHDGRGIAHVAGKATFIAGALPGDTVRFTYLTRRRRYDVGRMEALLASSADRVPPRCPHVDRCGGCGLQHLAAERQIAFKQQALLEDLARLGRVQPERVLPAVSGPYWAYRRRARLGVRYVERKQSALVGFREKHSSLLAELRVCPVLHPAVGTQLPALRALVGGLEARSAIPQIELAAGDETVGLVFRHLVPLSEADRAALCRYGEVQGVQIYLQPDGPDSVTLLWPAQASLSYRLPRYDLDLHFLPTDFTQVNGELNRLMVDQALSLLAVQARERVLDLYCGLGNFTLPLSRQADRAVGVEHDAKLVLRARENAARNGVANVTFHAADLTDPGAAWPWAEEDVHKVLLDPPRAGAWEVVSRLGRLKRLERVVYLSCNAATLSRDAGDLVQRQGFALKAVGVLDMFPHTTHVECLAVFDRR